MENTFLVCSILLRMSRGVSAPTPRRNVDRTAKLRHDARSGQIGPRSFANLAPNMCLYTMVPSYSPTNSSLTVNGLLAFSSSQ